MLRVRYGKGDKSRALAVDELSHLTLLCTQEVTGSNLVGSTGEVPPKSHPWT